LYEWGVESLHLRRIIADPQFMPERSPSPRLSAWIVLAMLAMIAVPAAITLHTVRAPAVVQMTSTNPTPYGYTWSLLLFVVPIVVIGW
jgi:hypothetical protein